MSNRYHLTVQDDRKYYGGHVGTIEECLQILPSFMHDGAGVTIEPLPTEEQLVIRAKAHLQKAEWELVKIVRESMNAYEANVWESMSPELQSLCGKVQNLANEVQSLRETLEAQDV